MDWCACSVQAPEVIQLMPCSYLNPSRDIPNSEKASATRPAWPRVTGTRFSGFSSAPAAGKLTQPLVVAPHTHPLALLQRHWPPRCPVRASPEPLPLGCGLPGTRSPRAHRHAPPLTFCRFFFRCRATLQATPTLLASCSISLPNPIAS